MKLGIIVAKMFFEILCKFSINDKPQLLLNSKFKVFTKSFDSVWYYIFVLIIRVKGSQAIIIGTNYSLLYNTELG